MSPEIKVLTADEARRFLNNKNVNWDHWPDTKKYLESIIKKETKMEQKSKWYKPWTWFGKWFVSNPKKNVEAYIEESKRWPSAEEMIQSMTGPSYAAPRNIPKKRAVKKPAKKKQAVKRGKK